MRALLSALLACMAVSLFAQQQQPPPPPTFRSGVDLVTLDVHVVDSNGQPVGDVRPDEFLVTVDGKPRRVGVANLVSYMPASSRPALGAAAQPAPPASVSDAGATAPVAASRGRLVLLVLDEANIRAGSARYAADAAAAFVDRAHPADRIGVLSIPHSSIKVEPTTDRHVVKAALQRVTGHMVSVETQMAAEHSVGLSEAFTLVHNPRAFGQVIIRECVEKDKTGGKEPGEPQRQPSPQCRVDVEHIARSVISDVRQRMLMSAQSLTAVVEALAQVEGPKTLVLVSEELPVADFLTERKDFEAETSKLGAAAARAQASVYVLQLNSPLFDVEQRMHPADATADADARAFGLETVTTLTGGRRLLISGRAEPAFERIARETSAFYLVGFEAEAGDRDGRPHVVTAKVSRKGVDVRARRQFVFSEPTQRALASIATRTAVPAPPAAPPSTPAASPGPVPAAAAPAPPADAVAAPTSAASPTGASPTAASPTAAAPLAAPANSLDAVAALAAEYVVSYGKQMEVVIGVERYAQWMQADDYARGVSQNLVSEFALMRTGNDWSGFRDVHEVDGKPVTDRQDRLLALVTQAPATAVEQARRIARESARYNMGAMQRNFNVPTTALLFVHPDNVRRFRFRKNGEERIDGILVWQVVFEESKKPTLIRTSAGKDMPVTATMWIDPTDGKILRTRMELKSEATMGGERDLSHDPGGFGDLLRPGRSTDDSVVRRVQTNATITVNYRPEPRLGIPVPVEMRESYLGPAVSKFSGKETVTKIDCRATYSDFKRFETSGRVVAPK